MGINPEDFFRDTYNSEMEHKYKLDAADSFLAVLLLALAGVGIYYSKLLPSCASGAAVCFFEVFTALFAVFSFLARSSLSFPSCPSQRGIT